MTKVTVLPHPESAPNGSEFEVKPGMTLCDALLEHGVEIEHACGKVGACTTCHVIVQAGSESLNVPEESEEDMLDRAWGVEPRSRLSCQAIVRNTPLTVEIPRYTVNHAKENS